MESGNCKMRVRTCLLLWIWCIVGVSSEGYTDVEILTLEQQQHTTISWASVPPPVIGGVTEIAGGVIVGRAQVLTRGHSPYLVREDLVIERTGELVIEPGVEVRFSSMVGLTVRGVLTARQLSAVICQSAPKKPRGYCTNNTKGLSAIQTKKAVKRQTCLRKSARPYMSRRTGLWSFKVGAESVWA
uniref:Uncharacterized protein n=1 Tax=Timema cristinae TaxID=61476 RepID=A0A7R9CNV0_TIMCR|nr:unnamed protein product [Timema cristinae]